MLKNSLHDKFLCGNVKKICDVDKFCAQHMLYSRILRSKSVVFVIYTVLLQGRFCRDLRAFARRKIEPKILPVEKKQFQRVWQTLSGHLHHKMNLLLVVVFRATFK